MDGDDLWPRISKSGWALSLVFYLRAGTVYVESCKIPRRLRDDNMREEVTLAGTRSRLHPSYRRKEQYARARGPGPAIASAIVNVLIVTNVFAQASAVVYSICSPLDHSVPQGTIVDVTASPYSRVARVGLMSTLSSHNNVYSHLHFCMRIALLRRY